MNGWPFPGGRMVKLLTTLLLIAIYVSQCTANDEILLRSLTAWREYEGIRVVGTAKRMVNDSVVEDVPFEVNISVGANGIPGKMEIGHRIRNPGEPHIHEPYIFKSAWAQSDDFTVFFKRSLVSEVLTNKKSHAILSTARVYDEPYSTIMRSLVCDVLGECPRAVGTNLPAIMKRNRLEVLGTEQFLGINATRVRVKSTEPSVDFSPHVEALIALEPTMQVLKFTSVRVSPDENNQPTVFSREVESVRIIGKWLICDRVWSYASDGGRWLVEIEAVQNLPSDYVGLWEINRLTGVDFLGELEQATRKGGPRIASPHSKEVSYIPFTQQEEEAIRRFLINRVAEIQPRVNWMKVLFWIANSVAICVLAYIGYRRVRFG